VPAIIQDERSGDVLMLGFMNPSPLRKRDAQEKLCSFSAHETKLWKKGESSGHGLARAGNCWWIVTPMRSLCVSKLRPRRLSRGLPKLFLPLDRTR